MDDNINAPIDPVPEPQVGSAAKETAPDYAVAHAAETLKIEEIEQEIEKTAELEKTGAEVISGEVQLPSILSDAGVQTVPGVSTPVMPSTQTPGPVLPITDDQVAAGLHVSMAKSFHWLALWCLRRLRQAHVLLKTIHGHTVRILLRK